MYSSEIVAWKDIDWKSPISFRRATFPNGIDIELESVESSFLGCVGCCLKFIDNFAYDIPVQEYIKECNAAFEYIKQDTSCIIGARLNIDISSDLMPDGKVYDNCEARVELNFNY